jgi:hypothetical protein
MIEPVSSLVLLEPLVSLLVLGAHHQEFSDPQTGVAFCMPHLPAGWKTPTELAKVCAEYPVHHLHLTIALGASSTPVPSAMAFLGESLVTCRVEEGKCRRIGVRA